VLSFFLLTVGLLSFDVIIFHSLQMSSFLCYHFSLYLLGVIIYVIICCYPFLLSFPPFFLFPENMTHSRLLEVLETWTKKHRKRFLHKDSTQKCKKGRNIDLFSNINNFLYICVENCFFLFLLIDGATSDNGIQWTLTITNYIWILLVPKGERSQKSIAGQRYFVTVTR
jgi:hypothetical protein